MGAGYLFRNPIRAGRASGGGFADEVPEEAGAKLVVQGDGEHHQGTRFSQRDVPAPLRGRTSSCQLIRRGFQERGEPGLVVALLVRFLGTNPLLVQEIEDCVI